MTSAWTVGEVVSASDGTLLCGDPRRVFDRISIDSRTIGSADLFVAIRGTRHDGHRFAPETVENGIRGVMVAQDAASGLPLSRWEAAGIACIAVADTTRALGALARHNRKRSGASVAALTGSNGKTSTREMIAAVLSRKCAVLTPEGNLNNEIGLPLTLLRLSPGYAWGVVELGMNHPGEIGYLAGICVPDIGIITNIGPAHLEGVGSIEGVMRAKGELLEALGSDRTAVLNGDDPLTLRLAKERKGSVLLFGESREADIRAEAVRTEGSGSRFTLRLPGETVEIELSVPGSFMVKNALAAAAVGHLARLTGSEIREGLRRFRAVKGRLNLIEIENGIHLIDDTYNANPGSMEAAISTLRSLKRERRSILVAGDMRELGKTSAELHRKIGVTAARSGIDRLYAAGEFAADLASGAREANLAEDHIFIGGKEAILENLKSHLAAGDWVLVKGSRAMGMEAIVQGLREWGREMDRKNKGSIGS